MMRNFLWFKTDGTLGGCATCTGGHPLEVDLTDPDNSHPIAESHRSNFAKDTPAGYVAYTCNCNPSVGLCPCASHRVWDSYLEGGVLVTKPGKVGYGMDLLLNGAVHNSTSISSPVDFAPGTHVNFQLRCADMPDGQTVVIESGVGMAALLSGPMTLTFTGGITNTATVVAPSQGMIGYLHGSSKYVALFNIFIRGWA